jgi:hypothetical protein
MIPPSKSGQIILALGGTPSETTISNLQMEKNFGMDKIANQIEQNHFKTLPKKDNTVHIYAHSFGSAVALILAQHLAASGFKVEKFITFGQPKTIRESDSTLYKNLPLMRIVDFHDPYFN